MNGLKYIRIRCNLSTKELAEIIGINEQVLNEWENGGEILGNHTEQLAHFFGIGEKYFGEISDLDKKYILEKAMFRCEDLDKECYCFNPPKGTINLKTVPIYFWDDRNQSLDEEYLLAQKRKQKLLNEIRTIIDWTTSTDDIDSKITCINRECGMYEMINQLMNFRREMKVPMKVPFYYELINVWKAMLMAYGLIDEECISYLEREKSFCGEDGEWIIELSQCIRAHWDKEHAAQEEHQREVRQRLLEKHTIGNRTNFSELGLEEQIAYAENCHRENRCNVSNENISEVICFY